MKYIVDLNNKKYEIDVTEQKAAVLSVADAPSRQPVARNRVISRPSHRSISPVKAPTVSGGKVIAAPMPGVVMKCAVSEGSSVAAGDLLLVFEAMKMENEVVSPVTGKVVSVMVKKGDSFNAGDILIVIE